jgi:hypothetical protein
MSADATHKKAKAPILKPGLCVQAVDDTGKTVIASVSAVERGEKFGKIPAEKHLSGGAKSESPDPRTGAFTRYTRSLKGEAA